SRARSKHRGHGAAAAADGGEGAAQQAVAGAIRASGLRSLDDLALLAPSPSLDRYRAAVRAKDAAMMREAADALVPEIQRLRFDEALARSALARARASIA